MESIIYWAGNRSCQIGLTMGHLFTLAALLMYMW